MSGGQWWLLILILKQHGKQVVTCAFSSFKIAQGTAVLDQKEFLYHHNFECMADRYRTRNCGIRTVLLIIS